MNHQYELFCIEESYKGANNYILRSISTGGLVLVDIGLLDSNRMESLMCSFGNAIEAVFITHGHLDHFAGLQHLKCYDKVYASNEAIHMMGNARLNLSRYTLESEIIEIVDPMNEISDEVIRTNSFEVRAYPSPGHTTGCTSFGIGPFLFTGDALIPGVKVPLNLPGSDKELYLNTFKKLEALLLEYDVLLPGHGKVFTNIREGIPEMYPSE